MAPSRQEGKGKSRSTESGSIILSIDFATTQSGAAYVRRNGREDPDPDLIESIREFPDDQLPRHERGMPSDQVPTEVSYPNPEASMSFMAIDVESDDEESDIETFDIFQNHVIKTPAGGHPNNSQNEEGSPPRTDSITPRSPTLDGQDGSNDEDSPRPLPDCARWGFECQRWPHLRNVTAESRIRNTPVCFMKLMLDESKVTEDIRRKQRKDLRNLRMMLLDESGSGRRIIERYRDVIVDFLTLFLQHGKCQLEIHCGLQDDEASEMVFTVPAIWSPKACMVMEAALMEAMDKARLIRAADIFMVSEQEAAAEFVLYDIPRISRRNTFILLDAGGGTVDAITLVVGATDPLRLEREAVEPDGKLCRSTFLNEAFYNFLSSTLHPDDFEHPEDFSPQLDGRIRRTLHDVIMSEGVMGAFETVVKRRMDFDNFRDALQWFQIDGLKENKARGSTAGWLKITKEVATFPCTCEYKKMFEETLAGVRAVLASQLKRCLESEHIVVDYVVLIGGFGGCPALVNKLDKFLKTVSPSLWHTPIKLHKAKPDQSAVAVARGGVMRAFNKEKGPKRKLRLSYGILRHESYDKEYAGHKWRRGKNVTRCRVDGLWIRSKKWKYDMKKNSELFFVSDQPVEDHWPRYHAKNKGKRCQAIGTIEVDVSDLRNEFPIEYPEDNAHSRPHYVIALGITVQINDRHIQVSAEYGGQILPGSAKYISIASAFRPGTK
ncbi:hypothetical protein NA57DRAFT_72548 [Rhizodiscina lignyota]|uniref:Uncharacterized protein n=1 Tax=Rhizodiscina lignyota TaxID=1504668 RepID=A0A9P4MAS7_9PEZI|nr:hypothetical protein NA57DRAFT_72548 [Rhizodiscina lignyota]